MRTPGLVATLVVLAATGCAPRGGADSPTGGLSLRLKVTGDENLAALYEVSADGVLAFGGGIDAQRDRVTWEGAMTGPEIDRLRALVEEHEWYTRRPVSSGEPKERRYRIKLRWPGGGKYYKVRGASPDVVQVQELLDKIARRRFDAYLRSLPAAKEGSPE